MEKSWNLVIELFCAFLAPRGISGARWREFTNAPPFLFFIFISTVDLICIKGALYVAVISECKVVFPIWCRFKNWNVKGFVCDESAGKVAVSQGVWRHAGDVTREEDEGDTRGRHTRTQNGQREYLYWFRIETVRACRRQWRLRPTTAAAAASAAASAATTTAAASAASVPEGAPAEVPVVGRRASAGVVRIASAGPSLKVRPLTATDWCALWPSILLAPRGATPSTTPRRWVALEAEGMTNI